MSAWELLYWYSIDVIKIYDGDSLTNCSLDLGFKLSQEKISLRFIGIDTPEMRGKTEIERAMARAAQAYVLDYLPRDQKAIINSCRDKEDVYGRALGWVYSNNDGLLDDWDIARNGLLIPAFSLNQRLVNVGIACPYDGKGARPAKGDPTFWPRWYDDHKVAIDPLLERFGQQEK